MDAVLDGVWLVGTLGLIAGGQIGLFWHALGLGLAPDKHGTHGISREVIEREHVRCLAFAALSCMATVTGIGLLVLFFTP